MSAPVFTPGHAVRLIDRVPGVWAVVHARGCWLCGFWHPLAGTYTGYGERRA